MAAHIAFVIQGKSHPLYKPHQVDFRDKVVIVNGKYVLLTGKKIDTKVYRHHTSKNELFNNRISWWFKVYFCKGLLGKELW